MNIVQSLPWVNWSNGIVMIVVFALVCVALVAMLVLFMKSGKKE